MVIAEHVPADSQYFPACRNSSARFTCVSWFSSVPAMSDETRASRAQAVAAINRPGHPEVSDVFLVFVGNGNGAPTLGDIAAPVTKIFCFCI